jgi:hypothetical protein
VEAHRGAPLGGDEAELEDRVLVPGIGLPAEADVGEGLVHADEPAYTAFGAIGRFWFDGAGRKAAKPECQASSEKILDQATPRATGKVRRTPIEKEPSMAEPLAPSLTA